MKVARPVPVKLIHEAAPAALDEIASSLRDLGLSGNAADAFGAMLRSRESTASELVARTGIPDSKIYYALEELATAGLIEVQAGKPKIYRVVPARDIRDQLSKVIDQDAAKAHTRAGRVASLVEPLRSSVSAPSADLAFVVKGRGNVTARARAMVTGARKDVLLMSSDRDLLRDLGGELLTCSRRRVRIRLAAAEGSVGADLAKVAEMRDILCKCAVLVTDGHQVLTISSLKDGTHYAIVSTDETLVRMATEYWDSPNCCEC